ncbi:protein of unknown function [Methylotuvimicrobium alcaliphilum 20Z]|uniref:Uncharacterized protein n=1 Tax=Methylotuvimicrobium alcaliphilum (strain DSM 19304 / NCIMB 14124 / VKM B-2133 / 20Z) TaxID=1091494 RepID=G4SXL1_META2|nr:protein of unknown function [Methylotuvimicrobium alcaliphilum 20Z]
MHSNSFEMTASIDIDRYLIYRRLESFYFNLTHAEARQFKLYPINCHI